VSFKKEQTVMTSGKLCRSVRAGAFVALSIAFFAPAASAGGTIVPLTSAMRATAETYLPGVVGEPVPAFVITPDLADISAGTRTYTIVSGPNAGRTEQHVIAALPRDATGRQWRYSVGDKRIAFLSEEPGQSLSVVADENIDQGVVTRYQPAEPLLIAGMQAGDTRTMTINASVYDLGSAGGKPEHTGTLDLTLTYVGAYKVTVPAGTFDAALLKWAYNGKIGPAKVDDTQARFIVPGIGMVAVAEKLDVSAMLVYNDKTKVGKVLTVMP
jgi:hypothetical protein